MPVPSGFWAKRIAMAGEPMKVERAAKLAGVSTPAVPAASATIVMIPTPIQAHQASRFGLEGSVNYMEAKPHVFYAQPNAALGPNLPIATGDDISYNGENYKVLTVIPIRDQGETLVLIVTATLHKVGS